MSKFISVSRRNPCPVCENTSGNCRTTDGDLILCMTHDGALPGWHYLGQSKDYLWGKYLPESDRPAPVRVERQKEPEKTIVPDSRKDKSYRSVIEQLELSDRHLQDFARRNLTAPEIEFLSTVTRSLPDGYLIPFPNVDGEFCGAQKRLDSSDRGRYRWHYLRKDWSLHNEFNEKPLAIYPIAGDSDPWIIEGTGVKPIVANIRHGLTVIGAAGGQHYKSPQTLSDTLFKIGNPKRVVFCPDAGDVINHHVLLRIRDNFECLESLGVQVTIAWWGQRTKQDPDIDHLPNLDAIEYLTPAQFWALSQVPAQSLEEEWIKSARRGYQSRRVFTPTTTINDRYLPDIPDGDIAIRSGMGTGKTEALKRLIHNWEGGAIFLGSRNSLLLQSIGRVNEGLHESNKFVHIHDDKNLYSLQDKGGRSALCFDSLDKVKDFSWLDGKLLIFDESVSSIKHLLIGSTLKHRRAKILKLLEELAKRVAAIVMTDGNQNNVFVEYLERLRGAKIPRLLNTAQASSLTVTITQPEKVRDYSYVLKCATESLNQGEVITFLSDSQRLCEAVDRLWSEGGYKTFRIDSKTMTDKAIKAIVSDPKIGEWLRSQGIQALILSPSAESGLDVSTLGYFSKGFAVFMGILDTDTQIQFLRRTREITEWLVHCPPYTTLRTDGNRSIFTGGVQRAIAESIALEMEGFEGFDLVEMIDNLNKSPHLETAQKLIASRNFEYKFTRECLENALKASGHKVSLLTVEHCPELAAQSKAIRKLLIRADAEQIFNAPAIDVYAARKIKESFNSSLDDRYKAERALLLDRLPGIEGTDLWNLELVERLLFTDRQRLTKLENFWLLKNIDLQTARTRRRIEAIVSGEVWAVDIGTRLAKLRYFRSLGVLEMVDSGAIVPDTQLEPLRERARDKRGKAVTLGLSPGKMGTSQWFGKILESHMGIRAIRGLNAIGAEFRSPVTDPLFQFVALRLSEKLEWESDAELVSLRSSWKSEWESGAEIPREEVTQTQTPQGVEVHTNQLNILKPDSSGWYSTQTHTLQGVEPDPSGEFLQPEKQAEPEPAEPKTEPAEPIPANQWKGRSVWVNSLQIHGTIENEPYPTPIGVWRVWVRTQHGSKSIECGDLNFEPVTIAA